MIFPDIDVDELIDAQLLCRLWHATNRTFDTRKIPQPTKHAIEAVDPATYAEMFPLPVSPK
jgi:hypothetical protein